MGEVPHEMSSMRSTMKSPLSARMVRACMEPNCALEHTL
jgi:hypothetical protein